jgi:hypothetical protein
MKLRIGSLILVLCSLALSVAAQVTGSGTTDYIPIWTSGSTLGDSTIFETQGMVGIGTTSPTATLHVVGPNGTGGPVPRNAPAAFWVTGGRGGVLGAGGPISLVSGTGGVVGPGGPINLASGAGGMGFFAAETAANGGPGGLTQLSAGPGGPGACRFKVCTGGGAGGSVQITAGGGGLGGRGGNGGSITLQPGGGGLGGTGGRGTPGELLLAPNGGKVGIGETGPANTFEIVAGGTTLADAWTTRSSRRFKTNIQPLAGALQKIEQLQGVSYERKADGKHEIGVVAEDVAQIVPEVVSRDPNTHDVQGVDYSRLTALLIEAVKAQQSEIQELKARIGQLTSPTPRQ